MDLREVRWRLPRAGVKEDGVTQVEAVAVATVRLPPDAGPLVVAVALVVERLPLLPGRRCRHTAVLRRLSSPRLTP